MIIESIMSWVIAFIGISIRPIFESVYSNLGIDPGSFQARLLIPTPIFFVVNVYLQFSVFLGPIALAWWVWRQVKS